MQLRSLIKAAARKKLSVVGEGPWNQQKKLKIPIKIKEGHDCSSLCKKCKELKTWASTQLIIENMLLKLCNSFITYIGKEGKQHSSTVGRSVN